MAKEFQSWGDDFYVTADDVSPTVLAWALKRGIFVNMGSDSAFATWSADGSVPITSPTAQQIYDNVSYYARGVERPDIGIYSISGTLNLTNPLPRRIVITNTGGASVQVNFPASNLATSFPLGQECVVVNNSTGVNSIVLRRFDATSIVTVAPGSQARVAASTFASQSGGLSAVITQSISAIGSQGLVYAGSIGNGASHTTTGPMGTGQIVVGKDAADPQLVTLSGDAAIGDTGILTLARAAVSPFLGGYVTGRWYSALMGGGVSTLVVAANTLYFMPMHVGIVKSWDRISINVTATGTATLARIGIYNMANGIPTTRVLDAGTVSVAGTGMANITINQSLAPGAYMLVVEFDGTATITAINGTSQYFSMVVPGFGTDFATMDPQMTATFTFGALPASITFGSGGIGAKTMSSANIPVIGLRAA